MPEIRFWVICIICGGGHEIIKDTNDPSTWKFIQDHVSEMLGFCNKCDSNTSHDG
jgi:hypothetical protein